MLHNGTAARRRAARSGAQLHLRALIGAPGRTPGPAPGYQNSLTGAAGERGRASPECNRRLRVRAGVRGQRGATRVRCAARTARSWRSPRPKSPTRGRPHRVSILSPCGCWGCVAAAVQGEMGGPQGEVMAGASGGQLGRVVRPAGAATGAQGPPPRGRPWRVSILGRRDSAGAS